VVTVVEDDPPPKTPVLLFEAELKKDIGRDEWLVCIVLQELV
jgi:hypothetical protein